MIYQGYQQFWPRVYIQYIYIYIYICIYIYVYVYVYVYVCVQDYISWWGPEYTQTHGDSCHGGDLNWGPMDTKAYKSYRMSFFEKVKMHKVSCKGYG